MGNGTEDYFLFGDVCPAERMGMGEANNVFNVFMSKPERIRSVLEFYLKEKVPQDWECSDANVFYTVRNGKGKVSFRQRDILKRIATAQGSYLLGIENQETINLILPWRLLQMDELTYERQIEEIQQQNVEIKAHYTREDDYKYKYLVSNRLEPIINLVLYWGKKKWREPQTLKKMANISAMGGKLERLFQDYKMNLINMRFIPEQALEQMNSDLKYVLGLMRCSDSQAKYEDYIMAHREYFSHLPKSAADVLDVCMNIRDVSKYLVYTEGVEEEEADMCKALEDIKKDAMRQGEEQGKEQGIEQGIERVNRLVQQLFCDGRVEDLKRSVTDVAFQKKLFVEYNI